MAIERVGSKVIKFYVPLAAYLAFLLFPFYWMVNTVFKSDMELYNLDLRDEDWWVTQAILKRLRTELSSLQNMHLAYHGTEQFEERQQEILRNIEMLTPEETKERKEREYRENWEWLKTKKRG